MEGKDDRPAGCFLSLSLPLKHTHKHTLIQMHAHTYKHPLCHSETKIQAEQASQWSFNSLREREKNLAT